MFNNIPSFLYKQKSNFHNFFTFIFPTKIINPKYLLTMYSKIVISCIQQHTRTFSLIILFSTAFYHFYTNKNQTFTIFFYTHFSNQDNQPKISPNNVLKKL